MLQISILFVISRPAFPGIKDDHLFEENYLPIMSIRAPTIVCFLLKFYKKKIGQCWLAVALRGIWPPCAEQNAGQFSINRVLNIGVKVFCFKHSKNLSLSVKNDRPFQVTTFCAPHISHVPCYAIAGWYHFTPCMGNLRPAGQIRPAKASHPARQGFSSGPRINFLGL